MLRSTSAARETQNASTTLRVRVLGLSLVSPRERTAKELRPPVAGEELLEGGAVLVVFAEIALKRVDEVHAVLRRLEHVVAHRGEARALANVQGGSDAVADDVVAILDNGHREDVRRALPRRAEGVERGADVLVRGTRVLEHANQRDVDVRRKLYAEHERSRCRALHVLAARGRRVRDATWTCSSTAVSVERGLAGSYSRAR